MSVREALLPRLKFVLQLLRRHLLLVGMLLVAISLSTWLTMWLVKWWNQRLDTTPPAEFSPGISYANYRAPKVPWSVHVVRVARANRDLDIQASHAGWAALGMNTLTRQIKMLPSELGTPLAGVNGDYYVREKSYAGDPRGLQIMNGELISGPNGGVSFWIDINNRFHATNVLPLFKLTWPDGTVSPFGLNEDRRSNNVMVLYTPAIGPSTKTVRGRELVLERDGDSPWLPLQAGLTYRARVRETYEQGDTCFPLDTMVLSLKPTTTNKLPVVQAGAILTFTTDTWPSIVGAKTALSGGPMLVCNGKRQSWKKPDLGGPLPYGLRSMWERHPRTAIGWNDKYFFMLEVDGRQQKLSMGMTLNEVADYMIRLGCREVMNLDGGGSAMFWCNGKIVNSPCDKRERDIANALVVLRKGAKARVATAVTATAPAETAAGPQ